MPLAFYNGLEEMYWITILLVPRVILMVKEKGCVKRKWINFEVKIFLSKLELSNPSTKTQNSEFESRKAEIRYSHC